MKYTYLATVLLFLAFSARLCHGQQTEPFPVDRLLERRVPMPSLEGNRAGDPVEQPMRIYLPPSYHRTTRRFPVVYYLHGFSQNPGSLARFAPGLDAGMQQPGALEFIVVAVNGYNRYIGSFYVNSPATGRWEDVVVRDAIAYTEANFRVIASPQSRGIAGFSMGGFGALNLALGHPKIYRAVYAVAPGVFDPDGLREAWELGAWNDAFKQAYGLAFAPGEDGASARFPAFTDTAEDQAVRTAWEKGFGNWEAKLAHARTQDTLPAIGLEYGATDEYPWIPKGTRHLSKILTAQGVVHTLKEHPGRHIMSRRIVEQSLVVFFSQHLRGE